MLASMDARGINGGGGRQEKRGAAAASDHPRDTFASAAARQSRSVVAGRKSCEGGEKWESERENTGCQVREEESTRVSTLEKSEQRRNRKKNHRRWGKEKVVD